MSLASVQSYVAGLLQGVTSPDFGPAKVYTVAPPQQDVLDAPVLYVWGMRGNRSRRTAPRGKPKTTGAAYRKTSWDLYLLLKASFTAGDPREPVAFPLLIEAVCLVLEQSPLGTFITDDDTQVRSQILSIGEDFPSIEYAAPVDITADGLRLHEAQIITTVIEDKLG